MNLQIASLNVRGIGDKQKRREMFNWLKAKNISIYFLQEVHCTENTTSFWKAEWGYKTLFSCCSSAKGGVAILFNNNFAFEIERIFLDTNGRFIICDIKTEGKYITLATLYAPNNDEPIFFQDFFDHLLDFRCEDLIIGGDFNLVLDLDKDKKSGRFKTHTNSVKILQKFMTELTLTDAWRVLNPDKRRYTWRRRNPEIHCRLDFFLVSQNMMCNVTHADILAGYKTDHSLIVIDTAIHSNQRGPGFWKLNTSFLTDLNYVNQIRTTIKEVKTEYERDDDVNPALLWEMIKLKIREQTLKYAKNKKAKTLKMEDELEKRINLLQNMIDYNGTGEQEKLDATKEQELKKAELERIIEYRTNGAILRAKCRWHNEGEKNTKYFLNLEKRHYKNGVINQLKTGENEFVTSDKEILSECETFYKNLYSSHLDASRNDFQNDNFFSVDTNTKVLDDRERQTCEGFITKQECLQALKDMEPNKTPGSDGLPAEFYKIFWNEISDYLINSINHAFGNGQLSVTQRRGIIKLIPKKDTETNLIKNWRPITLLNCDYKIAAKAIANRIKNVLPNMINNDQTGFIKGRFIGENIRLIDGVIQFAAAKNISGLLHFLDFEKAFDTVEWTFIQRTFKHFNFGPSIINWINTFYNNIESCVLNNGWSTHFFKPQRGVRQGCPLSPYLFIFCVEILAERIRNNKDSKGIFVHGNEIKISQYADDTTLILDGTKKSLTSSLQVLDDFKTISGLKLNNRKTEVLWIGANAGRKDILCPEKDLKWVTDKVKALGVWFSTNSEVSLEINYSEKLTKINNSLGCWEYRRLSLLGKITVLKSLIASQLVYILSPLPTNHRVVKEINNIFFKFLWDGKGDKIKRDVIIGNYSDGGLKMIDLYSFNKALKSTWVKKYLDPENHGKWKYFFDYELHKFGGQTVFRGNLNKNDMSKFTTSISDNFLAEILNIWSEISFDSDVNSFDHFLSTSLWYNSLIRIGNRPVYYKYWFSKGVQNVAHIMKDSNTYLSLQELKDRFNIQTNFLTFRSLISAVKALERTNKDRLLDRNTKFESFLERFLKSNKPNRVVYEKLIFLKQQPPYRSQNKWCVDCEVENMETIDWKSVYQLSFNCTKITKLNTFQFKLLHRRLATNDFLKKIGIKENDMCTFCRSEVESLIHLFWSCNVTSRFWQSFKQWLTTDKGIADIETINFTSTIILGLNTKVFKKKQLDIYFLMARYYIWICRTQGKDLNFQNFTNFVSFFL